MVTVEKVRGIIMTLVIAMVATILGSKFPVIGSAILQLLLV